MDLPPKAPSRVGHTMAPRILSSWDRKERVTHLILTRDRLLSPQQTWKEVFLKYLRQRIQLCRRGTSRVFAFWRRALRTKEFCQIDRISTIRSGVLRREEMVVWNGRRMREGSSPVWNILWRMIGDKKGGRRERRDQLLQQWIVRWRT